MRVRIDESRAYDLTFGIYDFSGRAVNAPDLNNASCFHGHIAAKAILACPVNHHAVLDKQIMSHSEVSVRYIANIAVEFEGKVSNAVHSSFAPVALMIGAHRASSSLMKRLAFSGLESTLSKPRSRDSF